VLESGNLCLALLLSPPEGVRVEEDRGKKETRSTKPTNYFFEEVKNRRISECCLSTSLVYTGHHNFFSLNPFLHLFITALDLFRD
jgi:hypothetical protein